MKKTVSARASENAVLLVGSGYGALKVAQDLAQSGFPLVWVTKAMHFLELPGGRASFTEWPEDLNFQFRPLYLRITRHPLVTAMTHARIESLEKGEDGFQTTIVQDPVYVDYDLCTGCGRCMEVCPLNDSDHPPLRRTPAYCPSRALDMDKRKPSPCREACPLGVNVQAYMALTAASRFEEALEVVREVNPLPGICGRVCHHPCEAVCRRSEVDEPVAICSVKRFLADWELKHRLPRLSAGSATPRQKRVAVIGAGPAGLTAAHVLRQAGFPVTVFEAHREAGGMLRVGINAFRLPRAILDREIAAIAETGVEIRTNAPVGDLKALFDQGFHAVLLCTGAHKDLSLGIPGEDTEGVLGAVGMLRAVNTAGALPAFGHVAVIGGGNSAIDAARAALRLGAKSVTICYRRERTEMPARVSEIEEAEEEGVKIEFRVAPTRVVVEKGKLKGLSLIRMKMGKPDQSGRRRPEPVKGSEFFFRADQAIVAIGQESHLDETGLRGTWQMDDSGRILVDGDYATTHSAVFAAGDIVTGPDTVVGAMAQGRQAALRVASYLTSSGADGKSGETKNPVRPEAINENNGGEYLEISETLPQQARLQMAKRRPQVRRRDFEEVEMGFTAEQAVEEAGRCLQCASCCECRVCETVCRDVAAIDHDSASQRITVTGPAVIVAAENEVRHELLDHKGIYRVGDFRRATDIVNVLMAGSASAGLAMTQGSVLRIQSKPGKASAKTPMGDESRLGIFICTCNGTMASERALERIRDIGRKMPGVVHSELVFSACHPRGADQIAAAVRSHKIGRVIMASCVCCPLEFQCISCNDQRNRSRLHLFNRLGLDRSRFETINIRDHVGAWADSDDLIVAKVRDYLREAFIRSKFLGPLRIGTTRIGNRILILGGSEAGLSCAQILDLQGFQIRMVHRCGLKGESEIPEDIRNRPLSTASGKNITHVSEAVIEGIRGHLGDFEVSAVEDGVRRKWKADIVCLADLNVLSLAIPEDMFGLKKFYRYNFAFFHTPQVGIYRVMPRTLKRVKAFQAGAALAAHVATTAAEAFLKDHELSPRVDPERCRGCGRCVDICPFDAVRLKANDRGFYTAEVLRHNCVGCGGCVGRCPVTAMDMPYFSNRLLEEIVASTLTEG